MRYLGPKNESGDVATQGDITAGGGGVSDHGLLTGLGDDDHTQYALADGSRGNFAPITHGHTISAKAATDAPSTYPTGFSLFGVTSAIGWPTANGVVKTFVISTSLVEQVFVSKDGSGRWMRIASSDNVWSEWETLYGDLPYGAAFRSTNLSIGNATWSRVLFDSTKEFSGLSYDASVGEFTILKAGLYYVQGHVTWNTSTAGRRLLQLMYTRSGSSFSLQRSELPAVRDYLTNSMSGIYRFEVGDKVFFDVYQASGATLAMLGDSNGTYVGFDIMCIDPEMSIGMPDPAFSHYLRCGTPGGVSSPSGSKVKLTGWSVEELIGISHNGVGDFTLNSAGVYSVELGISYPAVGSSPDTGRGAYLYINGGATAADQRGKIDSANANHSTMALCLVEEYFPAGTVLSAYSYQVSGSTLTTNDGYFRVKRLKS